MRHIATALAATTALWSVLAQSASAADRGVPDKVLTVAADSSGRCLVGPASTLGAMASAHTTGRITHLGPFRNADTGCSLLFTIHRQRQSVGGCYGGAQARLHYQPDLASWVFGIESTGSWGTSIKDQPARTEPGVIETLAHTTTKS